ncbi:MAG: GNAT family N-acetyltransferase [Gemmatimonadaceae bacterium]|nr:GNAT family N-acetyltransferase [Gemmatimonadaceae bacterium]
MRVIDVERTYLQLTSPPPETPFLAGDAPWSALPAGVRIDEVCDCPVATYRELYAAVGADYLWRDRLAWSDETLAVHLARRDVRVWILCDAEGEGGYFELVKGGDGAVEIAYFGLVRTRHGRGLGKALLSRAIAESWGWGATRVWLHTCTLDGPAALPNYIARGFVPYRRETYAVTLPDD